MLKKCNELIDPDSSFAKLYDEEENRFPLEELTSRHLACTSLIDLGMMHEELPYNEVLERAQTIVALFNHDECKALSRVKLILRTIEFHMKDTKKQHEAMLDSIPFLPVLPKPSDYPLSWAGDGCRLLSGKDLMMYSVSRKYTNENNGIIAGSQVSFLNEHSEGGCGELSNEVNNFLKVRTLPTCVEVVQQLRELIRTFESQTITEGQKSWFDHTCRQIYKFLDEQKGDEEIKSIQQLTKVPCVWTGMKFLYVHQVAKQWKLDGPYLHRVPSVLSSCKNLCKILSVKQDFRITDVESALGQMKQDFGNHSVDECFQHLLKELVSYLLEIKPDEFSDFKILLPDEKYILVWSPDLAYNDAPWAPRDEKYRYVNDIIPRTLAKQLHVKPVRAKLLEKYANTSSTFRGVEFGQREELTRRIQNILRDYPFDVTALKELLQNADDAKASKMFVILDKRTHGSQSILSEKWQKLQGPALLVWNDSTFSEKDIKGIQELGLGSKRSEAESIGQYGIGFNSVYHLTDCPSFVSSGDTLCVMDPHCKFVPGATPVSPGRRFDNLKAGFWDDFKDMKSAYLQSNIDNLPSEFLIGSLFRFPLRSTYDLVKSSKIAAELPGDNIVSSATMQRLLHAWAPKMKAAMFFLNNVRELRFFVIEGSTRVLKTQHHYCIDVSPSAQEKCDNLRKQISAFKEKKGCEPNIVRYPLTVIEIDHSSGKEEKYKEMWVIQQGVGDIEEKNQSWTFVKNVKPRHGLAAPVDVSGAKNQQSGTQYTEFRGQVFCFLPLPITSRLPVHVNGHFILNSTRRQLWQTTNPGEEDGRSVWNKNLLSAIASSYTNFLSSAHQHFVNQEYNKWNVLRDGVRNFYSIFPDADAQSLDEMWLAFAKECYKKTCKSNTNVLAIVEQVSPHEGKELKLAVSWHPIKSGSPSSQVYFWCEVYEQRKIVQPVLEAIGINITLAPFKLRSYLNDAIKEEANKCPEITPSSVFHYYSQFYSQITSCQFPCNIGTTSFKSVERFKAFTRYILQSSAVYDSKVFPSPPFGYPLLLTADGSLRKFDQHNKVLFSQFVKWFPHSSAYFVHPDLLDIKFSKTYFVKEGNNYGLIHRILSENLPHCLCDVPKCNNARSLYPLQNLQNLWLCFSLDPVFSSNLTSILNRWALILTTDDRLFSNISQLHPILPLSDGELSNVAVFNVLKRIGMPVVDTAVVVNTTGTRCPAISEHAEVLNSLFYLAQETDLSTNLSSGDVGILVEYLRSINYRVQQGSCHQVKSLPIFENVVGNFTSLSGLKGYVWPTDCTCSVAYNKWIRGYSIVFLKLHASWSKLGSASELGIEHIETENLYVKYIFPHFHLMSESERYEHLRYIRSSLFYINNFHVNYQSANARQRQNARLFISALRNLQCIGREGYPLRQVSDFCDHEQKIFTTFSRHFQFLPDYFTNNPREAPQWMDFFRQLGLKTTIAHDEYVKFCTETAEGQVTDVREASSVLIESLFTSKEEWYGHSGFLYKISRIGFLCSEKLPSLTWIVSAASASRRIQPSDGEYIDMIEPFKAASIELSTILWTVKPTVSLPANQELLAKLSVCTEPSTSDVVQNLSNICKQSQFADISLFDKYRNQLRPPENGKSLSSIILEHFRFLHGKTCDSSDYRILQELPCIPVYASPDSTVTSDMVLVKPQSVLTCMSVREYYPFLYKLPDEFNHVIHLLERLGVKGGLDLKHMQMVLESAHKCAEGKEMDPNTNKCVVKAIQFTYKTLKELKEDENRSNSMGNKEQLLTPLYLPSKNGTLVLSSQLLYHDEPYFYGKSLDLGATKYTELDISYMKYDFYQSQFCDLLPPSVRPRGISKLCTVKVASECQCCDSSDMARKLSSTLNLSILPKAVVTTVKHKFSKDKKVAKELQPLMDNVLKGIKVVTYSNLKLVISLKDTETVIGKVKVSYFLEKDESGHTLYMDTALKGTLVAHMFSELADLLMSSVQQLCTSTVPFSLKKTFEFFLRAESSADLIQELERRCLPIADVAANESVSLVIGMDIPQEWHYRLDQDVNNLFHANEYVGYEDDSGHIIIVKIVHAITSEGQHDSMCSYARKYLVYTSEDDETGTEVSVLSLYKFTKGVRKEVTQHVSHAVVPYKGEVNTSARNDYSESSLKAAKKRVCNELREIWQLDPESRERAVRRLYLKWHPDKNPDNPEFAEKVFQFLLDQIEKLHNGLPLDDPDNEQRTSTYAHGGSSTWWNRHFREWDQTAHQHRRYYARDNERRRGGPRASSNSSGWSHGSPFTAGDDNFRVPRQPEEGRRWLRQATVDHDALIMFHDQMISLNEDKFAGNVCFMAHQVAEKALKAGMYAICGLDAKDLKDHVLTRHAYALQTERPVETQHLAHHTACLLYTSPSPRDATLSRMPSSA